MLGEKSRYDIMSSAHNTLARFDSRHHPKQSGLPLTVGADQGDLLPAVNAECCVFQQGDTRIGFRNVFSFGNYFTGSLRERKAEIHGRSIIAHIFYPFHPFQRLDPGLDHFRLAGFRSESIDQLLFLTDLLLLIPEAVPLDRTSTRLTSSHYCATH